MKKRFMLLLTCAVALIMVNAGFALAATGIHKHTTAIGNGIVAPDQCIENCQERIVNRAVELRL